RRVASAGIAEGRDRRALAKMAGKVPAKMVALLLCDLRQARQRRARPVIQMRQVAEHEGVREAGHRQVRCDDYPTAAIERYTQRRAKLRRAHAGGPEDQARRKPLVAQQDMM